MRTLTLKNVSDELYASLRHAAKLHRRSLNQQAIFDLEAARRDGHFISEEELMADLADFRESLGFVAYDEEITQAKREGRP